MVEVQKGDFWYRCSSQRIQTQHLQRRPRRLEPEQLEGDPGAVGAGKKVSLYLEVKGVQDGTQVTFKICKVEDDSEVETLDPVQVSNGVAEVEWDVPALEEGVEGVAEEEQPARWRSKVERAVVAEPAELQAADVHPAPSISRPPAPPRPAGRPVQRLSTSVVRLEDPRKSRVRRGAAHARGAVGGVPPHLFFFSKA